MKYYKGVTTTDIPTGGGSYVDENQNGDEAYNFLSIRGYYYGYAHIQGNGSLWIHKLGANVWDKHVDGITVVLFAKNPQTGGQYIVGWYKKAKLFSTNQHLVNSIVKDKYYLSKALAQNSYLVKEQDRIFSIVGPGQANVWYAEEYKDKIFFKELENYFKDPDLYILKKKKGIRKISSWQKDSELRKRIENEAMEEVYKYFMLRNYKVMYVHKNNYGWDMEATNGKQTLLLEVKGLSGDLFCVDFTPNEYSNSKKNKKQYRICVVSNVLNKNKKLDIFYFEKDVWTNIDTKILKPKEIISARFFLL
jgi:hypothetical protein